MKIFVIPAKSLPQGVTVSDPVTGKAIPSTGAEVDNSKYWLRRAAAGEVTIGEKPAPAKAKKD